MPRKFRLSIPIKNGPRKRRGRSVAVSHVPLSLDTLEWTRPSFSISLPINILWELRASTFAVLQKRLKELSVLQFGMCFIVLYKLL